MAWFSSFLVTGLQVLKGKYGFNRCPPWLLYFHARQGGLWRSMAWKDMPNRTLRFYQRFLPIIRLPLLLVYWASAISSTTKGNKVWYVTALVEIIPRSHRKIRHMAALLMTIPETTKVSCLTPYKKRKRISTCAFCMVTSDWCRRILNSNLNVKIPPVMDRSITGEIFISF